MKSQLILSALFVSMISCLYGQNQINMGTPTFGDSTEEVNQTWRIPAGVYGDIVRIDPVVIVKLNGIEITGAVGGYAFIKQSDQYIHFSPPIMVESGDLLEIHCAKNQYLKLQLYRNEE